MRVLATRLFSLLLIAVSVPTFCQVVTTTGFPPYGSFENGAFDGVNHGSLNTNFSIPIANVPGRGLDFKLSLVYDSLIWQNVGGAWTPVQEVNGSPTWGWKLDNVFGASVHTESTSNIICHTGISTNPIVTGDPGTITTESQFIYRDTAGTPHAFNVSSSFNSCTGAVTGSFSGYALDNSGYFISIDSGGSGLATVFSPSGVTITPTSLTDPNGNQITKTTPVSNENDYTDTRGQIVLKIVDAPGTKTYNVLDQNGNYQQYVLTLAALPVNTGYDCSGIADYSGTATVPSQLTLPNGRSYTFSYEAGTLRLQRVTLPTGGFYEYDYPPAAPRGINCADGTYTSLTRLINDGTTTSTWTFSRDITAGVTTTTFPQLPYDSAANQTTYTFTNGLITSQKVYQGSAGGTLLEEIDTSYATNNTPAATNISVGSKVARIETDLDNLGNLNGLREFDWGAGAPGAPIRSTSITYLPANSFNLVNRPTNITIHDGALSAPVRSRIDITYDETANYTCVSTPPPNHDNTNFGCSFFGRGNPTTFTTYTDAATPAGAIAKHRFYDSLGNLLQADADVCQVQRFSFSSATQFAFPDTVFCGPSSGPFTRQQWTYNAFTGKPVTRIDENNQQTTFAYDLPFNRLTQITRPDNQIITLAYDDTNVKFTTEVPVQNTDRRRDTTSFDGLARPIRVTISNNSGAAISNTDTVYDPLGNVFKVSIPYLTAATDFTETHFDALSRITRVIAPTDGTANNTTTMFSYADNTLTVTDPAGKQIQYLLDAAGRTQAANEPDVNNNNTLTQNTSYAYTVRDELKQVTQGSQSRSYIYDDAGRLTRIQTPESGTVNYIFNSFDLPTQRTDARGVITSYAYDLMNRLSQVSYNVGTTGVPATPTLTYAYGSDTTQFNNGRLLTMTDGLGSESYSYDQLGRKMNIARVFSTRTLNIGYGYNFANEIASITYPSGRVITLNHDSYGRITSITGTKSGVTSTYASNYAYNAALQTTGLTYGNSVTGNFGFNAHNFQLGTVSYANPTQTLFSLSYGRTQNGGNNGQITQITDNVQPARSATYTYDALNRLQSAITSGGAPGFGRWGLSFAYDRFGNRTSQTVTAGSAPSQSASIDPASNRMVGYGYDANGNLTFEPTLNYSYTYDGENHLVSFSGNGSSSFAYDGNGLRAEKVATDGTATFSIFSQGRVIAEYLNSNGASAPGREFIYDGNGEYLLTIAGSGTVDFYHLDHQSVRLETDSSGNTAGERGDYPYGETWYSSGFFTPNNFTTYREETESVTDYAEFRYYSLRTGRFMQADPITGSTDDPQSWNRFTYVTDDPVNLMDPLGLQGGFETCTLDPNNSHNFICKAHAPLQDPPPTAPGIVGGGGPPAPFPGSDGGGGGGGLGGPRDPNPPKTKTAIVRCASTFANNHSLAAAFGAQHTTLGKVAGGNIVGGVVDLGLAVFTNESEDSVTSIGETIIPGGSRLGFPGGGPGSKGAAGLAQDAVLTATFNSTVGAAEPITQLGVSSSEVAFSSGVTGAEFATGVGEAKLAFDAAAFLVGLAVCRP